MWVCFEFTLNEVVKSVKEACKDKPAVFIAMTALGLLAAAISLSYTRASYYTHALYLFIDTALLLLLHC